MKGLAKLLLALVVIALIVPDNTWARGGGSRSGAHASGAHGGHGHHHGHRSGFGVFVGGAALVPWYAYYGPPLYPPYPAWYVEQDGYWYYCPPLQAYYPYVNQCPAEWQRVDPEPPAEAASGAARSDRRDSLRPG